MKVVEVPRFDHTTEERAAESYAHVMSRIEQVRLTLESPECTEPAEFQVELQKWKTELKALRELGGLFEIKGLARCNRVCITAASRVIFFHSQTQEEDVRYIDDVTKVSQVPDPAMPGVNRVRIEWRKRSNDPMPPNVYSFIVGNEYEFIEVLGAHLSRYNRRKKDMLGLLSNAYESIKLARDTETPAHYESLLCRLWARCFPGKPSPPWHTHPSPPEAPRDIFAPATDGGGGGGMGSASVSAVDVADTSVGWMALGFQTATHPEEDLVGAGALAIRHLLYFAECYPTRFSEIVKHADCPNPYFPLALVGISLTTLLFNMIHVPEEVLQNPETLEQDVDEAFLFRFLSHVGHARALEEVYCVLLDLFDREYMASTSAEHPEFLTVVHAVKRRIMRLLAQRPMSLDELHVLCDWRVAAGAE